MHVRVGSVFLLMLWGLGCSVASYQGQSSPTNSYLKGVSNSDEEVDGERYLELLVPGERQYGCPVSADKSTSIHFVTAVVPISRDGQDFMIQAVPCEILPERAPVVVFRIRPGECFDNLMRTLPALPVLGTIVPQSVIMASIGTANVHQSAVGQWITHQLEVEASRVNLAASLSSEQLLGSSTADAYADVAAPPPSVDGKLDGPPPILSFDVYASPEQCRSRYQLQLNALGTAVPQPVGGGAMLPSVPPRSPRFPR